MKDNVCSSELLEKSIGYNFRDKSILKTALTHSSYSNENKAKGRKIKCNERLEFLGDSVLSIVTSNYIFNKYKDLYEGELTKIRASVVCEKALFKYASDIELGKYMYLGHGEDMNHGRERASIISDAFEALIAAIYIDSSENIAEVEKFLLPFIESEINYINKNGNFDDYKTMLQQIVQQVNSEKLEYVLIGEDGPDHDKTFEVEVRLNSNVIGRGKARSKRAAEQKAARDALPLFGEQ